MSRVASMQCSVLLTTLLACGEAPGRIHAQQEAVSAQDDALELTLSVEPRALSPGDTARIQIELRNRSNGTLHLEVGGCPLVYYIENATGEIVVPEGGDWICIMILQMLEFAPGESRQRVETWSGESCPQVNPQRGCAPLPAGEYHVYATFRATESGQPVFLRTPEVAVRLQN